ncbi:MAG: penicillin acylase family protein, partial [Planctomycetota bacterium]|nr:penicillin acylase family protein [Planctomycetota bacterium]
MNLYRCVVLLLVSCVNGFALASSDGNPMMDSMPRLEGEIGVAGLSAPVEIHRDALAIPIISGKNLFDVIRAQGYLHAQERYVQLDMSRRLAAWELAELVGTMMLDSDL